MRASRIYVASMLMFAGLSHVMGQSGSSYRATAVHNGNQVRTVFGNWGVIGQPCDKGPRGAWKNDNNGYLGDVSPLMGAEIKWQGTTFHSVATCPVARPTQLTDTDPRTGKQWTLEPVTGYYNPNQQNIATSTNLNSWPAFWPDKVNDLTDPGWRGSWNGYFGKRANADQESYFVMDDNNDERFNFAVNNRFGIAFKPDSTNPNRNGMGLEVRVRGLQWAQFLAKDNIFWLYEIKNTGTTDYTKFVFGMLVGTYVGVTGCDDRPGEYDDDWSFYDVLNNITYTGDFPRDNSRNPLWTGPVGMVGYAFLESPGNPFDGIDNDGDAGDVPDAAAAQFFKARDFTDSTLVAPGSKLVLIDTAYNRTVFVVPDVDSVLVHTRGLSVLLRPHASPAQYLKPEGNILTDFQGNSFVNPNAYDGVDNNLNGIIDENIYLHYHQTKKTRTVPPVTLIDVSDSVRHIDYVSGAGTSPYSMIDERRDDLVDNNRDWNSAFDDVGLDGIPGTGDFGENDGAPTSGFARPQLNEPGEPHIDKTDVRESDQIGLTDFYYFTPSNKVRMGDKDSLWANLAPGFFDVPASIVNNRPERGEDGDFIYGSGFFPLLAGETERFSLALVYGGGKGGDVGADITDLLNNKKTVQDIYDANYQFPQPPDKPKLKAVVGDGRVTLYWDRHAEATVDPVLRTKIFEGYKIYRSTDPNFSDLFTVTDASGSPQGYRPLAQFDLKDGIKGFYRADSDLFQGASGYSYYLGNDNGLVHSYVDSSVENGRRYFYAVVAYSIGSEKKGIFPAENTKFVSIAPTGEISHDQNVVVVTPTGPTSGFVPPADGVPLLHRTRYGTGEVYGRIIDQTKVTGHTYQVTFFDTEVDSVDANGQPVANTSDSTKWSRVTTRYSVRDLSTIRESFRSQDTVLAYLNHANIIGSTVAITDDHGNPVDPSHYLLDLQRGSIRSVAAGTLPPGAYSISYEYFPVYKSPYILGSPFVVESKDADIFDGVELSFNNAWRVAEDVSASGWARAGVPRFAAYGFGAAPIVTQSIFTGDTIVGIQSPRDYDLQFSDSYADTSLQNDELGTEATPVKFRVFSPTDSSFVKFLYYSTIQFRPGYLSAGDGIVLMEQMPDGKLHPTWDIHFSARSGQADTVVYALTLGDTLKVRITKPFRFGDVLEYTPQPPRVDQSLARDQMSRIKVVPNPYVTSSAHELPLPPLITSGRGERRIEFIHVPANSKIRIFTSRGNLVRTLAQDGTIEDGTVVWDVKTDENLDIAYGVYLYIVESPVGTKTGKIAIIK